MKFEKVVNEGITNKNALSYVKTAIKELKRLNKRDSKKNILNYIKNNIVNNKQHFDSNLEYLEGAIESYKNGHSL